MKNKKMLFFVLLLIALLVGCGTTATAKENTSSFELEYLGESCDVSEYRDSETGVHYLILKDTKGYCGMGGICPRYNADGTLYVD